MLSMDAERRHSSADVAGTQGAASIRELRDAVRGRSRELDEQDAIHELGSRRPQRWAEVLREALREQDRRAEVRAAAAVELGREPGRANENALRAALDPAEPAVTRRAVEALGRIGRPGALEDLAALPVEAGALATSVELARILISYRHGLEEHRLAPPRQEEVVGATADGVEVDVEQLEARDADPLLEQLHPEVPAIPLARDGAMVLRCDEATRFLVLFTEQAHAGRALERFSRKGGVLAVVFEWFAGLERYELAEYLLTHAEADGRLRIFGLRSTGAMVHAGEIRIDDAEARFELRGLDRPHSLVVTLEGTIDRSTGRVSFSVARADPHAPSRRPVRLRLRDTER
jgi:hypothetical protein